jgi:hypothetical protein
MSLTIIKDAHTRAWVRAFLSRRPAELLSCGARDIDCRATARSESMIYWAAYITNIGSKSALREAELVSAEDTGQSRSRRRPVLVAATWQISSRLRDGRYPSK